MEVKWIAREELLRIYFPKSLPPSSDDRSGRVIDCFARPIPVDYDSEVAKEQVSAIDALVATEFAMGDWIEDI